MRSSGSRPLRDRMSRNVSKEDGKVRLISKSGHKSDLKAML